MCSKQYCDLWPRRGAGYYWLFTIVVLVIAFLSRGTGLAEEPVANSPFPSALGIAQNDNGSVKPHLDVPALKQEGNTYMRKSYLIPALEVPGFVLFLNAYDRLAHSDEMSGGKKVYETNPATFWKHITRGPWGYDQDNFKMNQLLHPYAGAIYYGFARSAGLNYWESLGYTVAGSFLWETAGETTHPSINDMVASGIGGTFFGEALFRSSPYMQL
jgi:hypothetical protein